MTLDPQTQTTIPLAHEPRSSVTFPVILNCLAIVAFVLGIFCCMMPGLQVLPNDRGLGIILAPLQFIGDLHLGVLLSIVIILSPFTYPLGLFLLYNSLWLIALWGWLVVRIHSRWHHHRRKQPLEKTPAWLIPLLASGLCLLWMTHLPLSISLTFHRPQLAALVEQVRTSPTGKLEFSIPQQVGLYSVRAVFRISDRVSSIVLNEKQSLWAYAGFAYEADPQTGTLDPRQKSLAPGSNNGDQDLLYLGEGWYAFQNLFD